MAPEDAHQSATGKKEGEKSRAWPSLTLEDPARTSPTFSALDSEHRLYPLAAWAYHHANSLEPAKRAGLFVALAHAWPLRGQRKSRHNRGFFVAILARANIPTAAIAQTFCISEGEVGDLLRDRRLDWLQPLGSATGDYRDDASKPRDSRPRIDTDPDDRAPFDPSTKCGRILSQENHGDENWRRVDELAHKLGYQDMADMLKTRANDSDTAR
jgi:hypothetical protein